MVTGANGFVGRHVIHELASRKLEIVGVGHGGSLDPKTQGLLKTYHQCDLSDPRQVTRLPLKQMDVVINLAGLARVGASFGLADQYKHTNVALLTVLGKRLLVLHSKARLIAISSGTVYDANQSLPLTETSKTIKDAAPYALSKLMMEHAAVGLRKKGLQCIIVRPFNHAGPGQAPGFLIPDLFHKIVRAQTTGQPVKVGNLTTKRDYTDVRDIARAYADLAVSETLSHELYNVCSGQSHSGEEVLEMLLSRLDLKKRVKIEVDIALIRPHDPPDLYASFERMHEETGWEPVIPLQKTIRDFIDSPG